MSAFIVSNECMEQIMNAVAAYFEDCRKECPLLDKMDGKTMEEKVLAFGQKLYDTNVDSVNYRYDEDTKHIPLHWECHIDGSKEALVIAIKQLHSLEYQSCELDDYDEMDEAKSICQLQALFGKKFLTALGRTHIPNDPDKLRAEVQSTAAYRSCNYWG